MKIGNVEQLLRDILYAARTHRIPEARFKPGRYRKLIQWAINKHRAGWIHLNFGTSEGAKEIVISFLHWRGLRYSLTVQRSDHGPRFLYTFSPSRHPNPYLVFSDKDQIKQRAELKKQKRLQYIAHQLDKAGIQYPEKWLPEIRFYKGLARYAGLVGTPYGWYAAKKKAYGPYSMLRLNGVHTYPGDPDLKQKLDEALAKGSIRRIEFKKR